MNDDYTGKHADAAPERVGLAAALSACYTPRHAAPEVEVVVVRYTGHGIDHGTYRADVQALGLLAPL